MESLNIICDEYCRYPGELDADMDEICGECPIGKLPVKAEEGAMYLRQDEKTCVWKDAEELRYFDKALFVRNVGWLLSQTREGVESACMIDENTASIVYNNGSTRDVNIEMCSYLAIVKEICRKV